MGIRFRKRPDAHFNMGEGRLLLWLVSHGQFLEATAVNDRIAFVA